jgi:hypothetical protein
VVKTATRRFPQAYLASLELTTCGEYRGVYSKSLENPMQKKMMAFLWSDKDRRYFIASRSSLELGKPYERGRWRQNDPAPNADAERVEFEIPQPKAAEEYYSTCAAIDRHNRSRQDDLMLERKLGTMFWNTRVNLTIFGICVVDAYYVAKGCNIFAEPPARFFGNLAQELIDNKYNSRSTRVQEQASAGAASSNASLFHLHHLTPTRKKRKDKNGKPLRFALQGQCRECCQKTSYVCRTCKDTVLSGPEPWYCHSKNGGRECFNDHCEKVHSNKI